MRHHKHSSITNGSSKDFNFDSVDRGHSDKHTSIGSDWRATENVIEKEVVPSKKWSFPLLQPGVSGYKVLALHAVCKKNAA